MANTGNERYARESRGQVARRLFQEVKRVKGRLQMQEGVEFVSVKKTAVWAGNYLHDLILDKFLVKLKDWDDVITELIKWINEQEAAKERKRQVIKE